MFRRSVNDVTVHTFHLARTSLVTTAKAFLRPPTSATVPGLQHAECLTTMQLGARVLSPQRLQLTRLAMFAAWDNEEAIDDFLARPGLGAAFADGWHVRMEFLRRWGHITEFDGLPISTGATDPDLPVVAVTLARLKHSQLFRFIKWGKPVEQLVRDDPATTISLAAMHPLNTVQALWLLPVGILAALGQLCMTRAYTRGATMVVANLQYSGIIFAALFGVLLFGDQMAPIGWLGMATIILSGMTATFLRARALSNPPAESH